MAATRRQQTACDVDVVASAVDTQEHVPGDEDFVFHGAPEHPDGTVRLATDGKRAQALAGGRHVLEHRSAQIGAGCGTPVRASVGRVVTDAVASPLPV